MSWVKIDDGAPEHRKMLDIAQRCGEGPRGAAACWLWVCGLCYANRQPARDGFIPAVKVGQLYPVKDTQGLAHLLVTVGLWEGEEGGYRIHDYHSYQPDAAHVERVSEARRKAGAAGGKASGKQRRSNAEANCFEANEANPEQPIEAKSNPVPSRPEDPPHTPPRAGGSGGDLFGQQGGKQGRKAKRAREQVEHHAAAMRVFGALNDARKRVRPTATGLTATADALAGIVGRLAAGYTVEDCMIVVAVCEEECRRDGDQVAYFDAVTPWRPANFERKLARGKDRRGHNPVPAVREWTDEEQIAAIREHGRRMGL